MGDTIDAPAFEADRATGGVENYLARRRVSARSAFNLRQAYGRLDRGRSGP